MLAKREKNFTSKFLIELQTEEKNVPFPMDYDLDFNFMMMEFSNR